MSRRMRGSTVRMSTSRSFGSAPSDTQPQRKLTTSAILASVSEVERIDLEAGCGRIQYQLVHVVAWIAANVVESSGRDEEKTALAFVETDVGARVSFIEPEFVLLDVNGHRLASGAGERHGGRATIDQSDEIRPVVRSSLRTQGFI